jgi:hypothetical protein
MAPNPLTEGIRRTRAFLESRAVSFWVLGAWIALTLVWLVPFQLTGQSHETIRAIAEDWLAFRAVYVAVGLTTVVCAWTRMARDMRRAQRTDVTHPAPTPDAERIQGLDLDGVDSSLRARRYAVTRSDGSLYAVRNRYSLLGGSIFHFGIVLLGVSLVAHLLTVDSTTLRVTEGQSVGEAAAASGVVVPSAFRYFTLESIQPQYFEDVLLFTKLEARLSAADGSSRVFSLSQPYWIGPTTLASISDFNLAPHIETTAPDGTVQEYVVAMNLSPPGAEDAVAMPDVPFEMSLIAFPDHGVVDGRDVSLSYNIREPAFLVAVKEPGRTGSLVARELVGIGEPIEADGYAIRISGLSRYGTFRVTTAPALPFMALSFLVMTVGVSWRLLLRRHSVMAWADSDGVVVDGWLDMAGRSAGRELGVELLRKARKAS